MIVGLDGNRSTPKRRAQEVLFSALSVALSQAGYLRNEPGMTEREREETARFVQSEADRLARVLGYTECPQE